MKKDELPALCDLKSSASLANWSNKYSLKFSSFLFRFKSNEQQIFFFNLKKLQALMNGRGPMGMTVCEVFRHIQVMQRKIFFKNKS